MSKSRKIFYKSFDDDFFDDGKSHTLPDDYKWIKTNVFSRIFSGILYSLALIFSNIYCRLFLHVKFEGKANLKVVKNGYFIYGNHTLPVGDVFNPALACFPKRIYTVVAPSNLDLPVIGKLLPFLGALPLADSFGGMKHFKSALKYRINSGHPVVIYPEAHVWEYYTKLRPFKNTSFKYPINLNVPSFSMTASFQKRKIGKKPKVTIYIDGPFYPEGKTDKEKIENLYNSISAAMKTRTEESNTEYIEYIKDNSPV